MKAGTVIYTRYKTDTTNLFTIITSVARVVFARLIQLFDKENLSHTGIVAIIGNTPFVYEYLVSTGGYTKTNYYDWYKKNNLPNKQILISEPIIEIDNRKLRHRLYFIPPIERRYSYISLILALLPMFEKKLIIKNPKGKICTELVVYAFQPFIKGLDKPRYSYKLYELYKELVINLKTHKELRRI